MDISNIIRSASLDELAKEIAFTSGIEQLREHKFPVDEWYWKPQSYIAGIPIANMDVALIEANQIIEYMRHPPIAITNKDIEKYIAHINTIIRRTKFNLQGLKPKFWQLAAIGRYGAIGALSNISLSVSPQLKRQWKITFELFGAFYNTSSPYCGLFSDIEPNSFGDCSQFQLQSNETLLINPPYTQDWIVLSCKIVERLLVLKKRTTIYLVIPVWNKSDREKLKLPGTFDDIPEIDKLKQHPNILSHKLTNLQFFNGITKKHVFLRDKVHLFVFKC